MAFTHRELRDILVRDNLTWQLDPAIADDERIPERALGAVTEGLIRAADAPRLDLRRELVDSANPHLAVRRVELGLADPHHLTELYSDPALRRLGVRLDRLHSNEPGVLERHIADRALVDRGLLDAVMGGTGRSTSVDWRNRFGRNWITSVRDQNPCSSCWAFAGTALVEAMTMIEHSMWTRRSEGDVHDGVGLRCGDGNNMGTVSDFFRDHGLADPGCWPYHTDDAPYAPTPDREGRTVRGPAFTWIGDIEQQKTWIDTVGPIVTWLDVYHDFDGYHSGVYRKSTDPANYERGGHFMLVVGYDDAQQAWLCKNSWGTGWGMSGYIWFGYGEAGIDTYAKAALQDTNPDPWTKRRLHNGNLYESGNGGLHRNLEVAGATSGRVTHHWREGGPPWSWKTAAQFATDAAACPTYTATTFDRNMEVVYLTTDSRLHHWWVPGGGGNWNDGGVFGPADCRGVPGFVQGDYGAPGNFEVVVGVGGGQLMHLWRDGAFNWHDGPRFGVDVAMSGPSLVQGQYGDPPHGNLELVAVLGNGAMQHFWRSENDFAWHDGVQFGAGIGSPPVMIQGQYGMADETGIGNFELCAAAGGQIQHWWRDNASGSMAWYHSATFGHDVMAVAGLCESSWGMNLEVIALRTDGQLQHYWRDGAGWHEGPVIGQA